MSISQPKLSVLVLAYNHGPFIRQAIESALAQQTNFPVEIVVGEDCSTDDTRAILRELARSHPDRIRLLLRDRNLGAYLNLLDTFANCRGEFIAALEGDDFWTFPGKLQRQVDQLESQPDCVLCFHDALVVEAKSTHTAQRLYCDPKPARFPTIEDLLVRNFIPSCSVVYRRNLLSYDSPAIRALPMQDWPAWVQLAMRGRLVYIDEIWGSYRLHAAGIWSGLPDEARCRHVLRFYETMLRQVPPDCRAQVRTQIKSTLSALVETLVAQGRWREARGPAWSYLRLPPRRFRAPPTRSTLYCRLILGRPSAVMTGQA